MKTLYLTQSSDNIVVDPEIDFVGRLQTQDRYDIRSVYYVEEPMHIVYQCGEKKEEIDARKGDIVLVFYSNDYNVYNLDTIHTKQWAANIKNKQKLEQKAKEEWAWKKAKTESCEGCDCCDACPNLTEAPVVSETPKKESTTQKIKKALKKIAKK